MKAVRVLLPAMFLSLPLSLFPNPAEAQVEIYDPIGSGWITAILGAANMDDDPADEIVVTAGDGTNNKVVIIDCATGEIQFNSDSQNWIAARPAGYNLRDTDHSLGGHNAGFDIFCDTDGDGVYCLMLIVSTFSVNEQELAIVCLGDAPTSVTDDVSSIPDASIRQNHPNPFNPSTVISYELDSPAEADLRIYTVSGRLVRTLAGTYQEAGVHRVTWDGTADSGEEVGSGTYLYQLVVDGKPLGAKKAVLVR